MGLSPQPATAISILAVLGFIPLRRTRQETRIQIADDIAHLLLLGENNGEGLREQAEAKLIKIEAQIKTRVLDSVSSYGC
ncbi:MAG: hypothetical protein R8K20_10545 [Gallionellaceae bacterium]